MSFITNNSRLDDLDRPKPTPKKQPITLNQGVNFIQDDFAKGFTINKQPKSTDFIDINTNKPIDEASNIPQGKPQKFIDSRGNTEQKFSSGRPFTLVHKTSRLLRLHEGGVGADTLRQTNEGYTNYLPATTLDNYYKRLNEQEGVLGLRKNDRFGFDQPFVIRDVGNRLGFDGFENFTPNNTIARILDKAGGFLNDIGGAVLGREPNEYLGAAGNELKRDGKFLLTTKGVGFLAKQGILQRRNAQKIRTDVRYGLSNNVTDKIQNTRLYNPLSLASLPGVTKININTPDASLPIQESINDVTRLVSKKVIDLATTVAGTLVKNVGGVAKDVAGFVLDKSGVRQLRSRKLPFANSVNRLKKAGEAFQNAEDNLSKLSQIQIDNKAFADVGKDRVNLIPYGKKKDTEKQKLDNQDYCPFRFEDADGNIIYFRAVLSGINDTFSPEYASERYVGRPDSVYVYQGTNREISFTFDVYPKSDEELIILWEKMNYLAGLTYPDYASLPGGGQAMLAPFCRLTIGQMYRDSYGYISSLSYAVQDNGTWETHFAKLPKYIQASCTFVYVGNRLPSKNQKHFEVPWVPEEEFKFETNYLTKGFRSALRDRNRRSAGFFKGTTSEQRLNAIRKKLDFG